MPQKPDLVLSRRARIVLLILFVPSMANYILRLFSVSVLDWRWAQSATIRARLREDADGTFAAVVMQANAWMEFGLFNAVLLAGAALCYLVVLGREGRRFVRRGRATLRLSGFSHLMLVGIWGLAVFSCYDFQTGATFGGRLSALPYSLRGLMIWVIVNGAFFMMAAMAIDPRRMQANLAASVARYERVR